MNYKKNLFRTENSQSTLEYVIILAVVIGAIIAVGTIFQSDLSIIYNSAYK